MLPLVSGINSQLPSVNHTLISPILPHPVVWVALAPSVPSTHHSHHPSPLHSFTPGCQVVLMERGAGADRHTARRWRAQLTAAIRTLCQARGYPPSRRSSPPFGRYQFILLGEQRHICVNNLPKVVTWKRNVRDTNLRLFESKVPNHYTTTLGHTLQYNTIQVIVLRVSSELWHCWLGVSKSIRPVKIEW